MKCAAYHMVNIILACSALLSCGEKNSDRANTEVEVFVANLYGGTGGVSVDRDGNVYVSDFGPILGGPRFLVYDRIFRITPDRVVSIFADSIAGASGSFIGADGILYQSNIRGNVITQISRDGQKKILAKDSISSPVGITMNADGDLVVCNCGNNTLFKISIAGRPTLFVRNELLQCPNGITMDIAGNYYVANFYNGNVIKVTPGGVASVFAEIPGGNNGHLVYHAESLYVIARAANQIYRVSMSGSVELFAGSGKRGRTNASRLASSFNFPNDLDFSPDGKYMYVNEEADTLSDPQILTPTVVRRIRMDLNPR
jgi:sugar lactone lactonase YvrE